MRLWTLHPKYLDPKGLTALWREALLAQKVLQGATRGYRNHPQLIRFKQQSDPPASIAVYLRAVYQEAMQRGYHFDQTKISTAHHAPCIPATTGQIAYEWKHLKAKLRARNQEKYRELLRVCDPEVHPLFAIKEGEREAWEIKK